MARATAPTTASPASAAPGRRRSRLTQAWGCDSLKAGIAAPRMPSTTAGRSATAGVARDRRPRTPRSPEEEEHEAGDQQELDVAAQDRLGEWRPQEQERGGRPRDAQPADDQQRGSHADHQPRAPDDFPRQQRERREEWQHEGGVEEGKVVAGPCLERRREVRLTAGKPPLGGPQRDLEVGERGVAGEQVADADQRDAARESPQEGAEQPVRAAVDLERSGESHAVDSRPSGDP